MPEEAEAMVPPMTKEEFDIKTTDTPGQAGRCVSPLPQGGWPPYPI